MKNITAFSIAFLAAMPLTAFADRLDWQDLRPEDEVRLEQPLSLVTLKGVPLEIPVGTPLVVEDVLGLDISVVDVVFKFEKCPVEKPETDMVLILPEGGRERSEVGVQVSASCTLEVFIETKDYSSPGFMGTR